MNYRKIYISYVIQTHYGHTHYAEVVELPLPETALYTDNTGQEVYRWAQKKQERLSGDEKVIVQNYFLV